MRYTWDVVIEQQENGEPTETFQYCVEAHILDGALSCASKKFNEKVGRLPSDAEFVKVERLSATPKDS